MCIVILYIITFVIISVFSIYMNLIYHRFLCSTMFLYLSIYMLTSIYNIYYLYMYACKLQVQEEIVLSKSKDTHALAYIERERD
jgi:hypothetical protein